MFRRVLVALDASRASRGALEASAGIATGLRAELVGLFVEDVNLLRLAAFPATRVLAPGSSACDLDVPTIERALRAAAAEARGFLESLARRNDVPCAFRVVRGLIASEVVAGSDAGDLVVVDQRTAGAAWTAIVADARASILLLEAQPSDRGSLVAVYPDEPAWEEGVSGVARLALATGRSLAVVRPPGAEQDEFERRLGSLFAASEVRWEAIGPPVDVDAIAAALRARPGVVVAMPSTLFSMASGGDVEALLRRAACSILLVR